MSELEHFDEDRGTLKVELIKKLLLVLALILLAVGGLNVYDSLSSHPKPAPAPVQPIKPAPLVQTPQAQTPVIQIPVQAPQAQAPVIQAQSSASQPQVAQAPAAPAPVTPVANPPMPAALKPVSTPAVQAVSAPAPAPKVVAAQPLAAVVEQPVGEMKRIVSHKSREKAAEPRPAREEYLIQVGVFSSLENAEKLEAKLKAKKLSPKIESKVRTGPFKDEKEAEEAAKKLHAAGVDGVAVHDGEYYVQAGIFTSVKNARAMSEKVKKAGVPLKTETRVRIGPYGGKARAEAEKKRLLEGGFSAILVPKKP